ncbi:hypothetical protein DFH09DRAFT_1317055 [Mycena vulgaris]|nr:hypothetical protein DFH09DRAFT_1317055 [Mycena vulgaris]
MSYISARLSRRRRQPGSNVRCNKISSLCPARTASTLSKYTSKVRKLGGKSAPDKRPTNLGARGVIGCCTPLLGIYSTATDLAAHMPLPGSRFSRRIFLFSYSLGLSHFFRV